MKKSDWKRAIIKQSQSLGTYKPEFSPVISTLADLLEERDRVRRQYNAEGAQPMVEKISDRGAVNKAKNPLLSTWEDLNRDALAYWRELGLTPAGLKKLSEDSLKISKPSALAEALRDIG